jgi:hypothetical protein
MTARRTMRIDGHGTVRSGPADAWWTWLKERPQRELPSGRLLAYNVVSVGWLLGGGVVTYHYDALGRYLSGLALLSALGIVGGVLFIRHLSRQETSRQLPDRSQTAVQTAPQTGRRTALRTGE